MSDLEFTGERFLPGTPGGIAYEHWHRYAFALRHAAGRRVLDAACGEGYGTALLASVAAAATGVDIDPEAVSHARAAYAQVANVTFECGSVTALPLADASVDVAVSFETIEHLPAADQPRMLAEFARVLTPDGVLVLSSPNRRRYSDERNYTNPFHLHELYRRDLEQLLDRDFVARRWYDQVPLIASAIFGEGAGIAGEAWFSTPGAVTQSAAPDGMYYLVVAAKAPAALPGEEPRLSVLTDADQTELARAEHHAAEVLRLDALLKQRDDQAQQRARHVEHLERLLGHCEGVVQERDRELATCKDAAGALERELDGACRALAQARAALASSEAALAEARVDPASRQADLEHVRNRTRELEVALGAHEAALVAREGELAAHEGERVAREGELAAREGELDELRKRARELEAALSAQERIIAYRQTLLWWAQLPWVRARSWWQRHAT